MASAQMLTIQLSKGDSPNLGFRLQGGKDFATPLVIQKINGGSPAERAGLIAGDAVIKINNHDVFNLRHKDAQDVIIQAGPAFTITVQRGGSTWKPTVASTGPTPAVGSSINQISPVTKTSLAANPQQSIGAIGTGHNVSAKPFLNGTANGGPKLVNKQYNSPLGLYSEQSIAETLSAQSEVLSTGVLGVNFKKNEKDYDATKSAVYHMLQEAEREPRDLDSEPDSGVVIAPLGGLQGLKHVQAPESKPTPPTPQLPPGQNVCADCERLIVGVFVRIKDKNLHVECFKCSTCGTSLKNVGYYNINNKLYCDVHAKLAARSNPPAPNLVPVTVPPGGIAPAGTISAALASHSLPSPGPHSPRAGPISPSSNITAAPFQPNLDVNANLTESAKLLKSLTLAAAKKSSANMDETIVLEKEFPKRSSFILDDSATTTPAFYNKYGKAGHNFTSAPRPFTSVTAPLSPNNYSRPLPKTPVAAPVAPVAPPSYAPGVAPAKPAGGLFKEEKCQIVQNIVWPPSSEEPEVPTASPLYFPPPSQVNVQQYYFKEPESSSQIEECKSFRKTESSLVTSEVKDTSTVTTAQTEQARSLGSKVLEGQSLNIDKSVTESEKSIIESEKSQECESIRQESDYTQQEDISNLQVPMDPRMSLCSSEVCNITKSAFECAESITEHIETQMLVESIIKNRPRSPPPLDVDPIPPMREPEEPPKKPEPSKIAVCPCDKSCCSDKCPTCPLREPADLKTPHQYQKTSPPPSKIQNAVPQKWESPMLTALKVTPDSLSQFPQIPQRQQSAMLSALSIAPTEPFQPALASSRKPIPLPEETVPYLPPERPIIPKEPKPVKKPPEKPPTPFVEALKIAPDRPFSPVGRAPTPVKPKKQPDPLLKDLPKFERKMTMLDALTTAPGRSYSPLDIEVFQTKQEEVMQIQEAVKEEETKKFQIKLPVPQPFISAMKNTFEGSVETEAVSNFPPVSSELREYRADVRQESREFQHELMMQQVESQIVEENQHKTESSHTTEESLRKTASYKEVQQNQVVEKQMRSTQAQQLVESRQQIQQTRKSQDVAKQSEEIIYKKPINYTSALQKTEYLPQYQTSLQFDEEIQLPRHKNINKLLEPQKKTVVPNPRPILRADVQAAQSAPKITKPVTMIEPGHQNPNIQITFQPVQDDFQPPQCAMPQRVGRSLTPSSINKPPSAIPYYQQNLVATEFLAPEINLYDPKSPGHSRSPSPCLGGTQRPASPFRRSSPRPKSPATGPPLNPLRVNQKVNIKEDLKVEKAKDSVTSYIPQHRDKLEAIMKLEGDTYSGTPQDRERIHERTEAVSEISRDNYQQKQFQAQDYQAESTKSHQVSQKGDMSISISEASKLEQLQQLNKSQMQSVETHGNVQIQRKKTVTEEFEHSHKEKVIEIEKSSSQSHPFQRVNVPVQEQHGILGLHVTNPQPLVSPFLQNQPTQPPRPLVQPQHPQVPQPVKPVMIPQPQKSVPPPQPEPPKPPVRPVQVPQPSKITAPVPPITQSLDQCVNPGVPAPSVGSGGGRQAGGNVFAPKRGRGVLNVGGLVGSRVAQCGHCHQQIRGPFITALGKIWCPEHFTCATPSCKRPLQDIGFVEERGQLHCEYCFEQYLAPDCAKCNIKIKGDCLKAIGKNFHPECFCCSYCNKLFGNSPFFLEDGLPYCETDWNEMFTTKCFACGYPVEAGDRWVEALSNNYHSQCFNCTMCKKNLEGQSFFAKGGRPFCKNHAR